MQNLLLIGAIKHFSRLIKSKPLFFFSNDLAVSEPGNSKTWHFSDNNPCKQNSGLAISEPGKKSQCPALPKRILV